MTKNTLMMLLVAVSITTGCGSFAWVKNGATQAEIQRDESKCKHQMEIDSVRGGYEEDYVRQQQLLRLCMKEKGYDRK